MVAEGAADAPACAVGRLEPQGPWIGFAPTLDDGYALVMGDTAGPSRWPARAEDLVAVAMLYFEDGLAEPPEELTATLGDIAALVRHVAEAQADGDAGDRYQEAVDAIDDGLPADVVLERLARILGDDADAEGRLRARLRSLGAWR